MKQVIYLVRDVMGDLKARVVLPEEEPLALEPWMVHNINHQGWRVDAYAVEAAAVTVHGWVDWASVARTLAEALEEVNLALGKKKTTLAKVRTDTMDQRQAALDAFHLAEMEGSISVVTDPAALPDHDPGSDGAPYGNG